MIAASRGRHHCQPIPLDVLERRVQQIRETRRRCGFGVVGEQLPGLIADLHSSIAAGREVKALVELAVEGLDHYAHVLNQQKRIKLS